MPDDKAKAKKPAAKKAPAKKAPANPAPAKKEAAPKAPAATKPPAKKADPAEGLTIMGYHVKGSQHANTLVRLKRVQPKGPLSKKWMVIAGGKIVDLRGQKLPGAPFARFSSKMQERIAHDWADALKLARKA